MENQDDNAGFHEKMIFCRTCKFDRREADLHEILQFASQKIASQMVGWMMWPGSHARGDNTSWGGCLYRRDVDDPNAPEEVSEGPQAL